MTIQSDESERTVNQPCVLKIVHKGQPKMVGKVVEYQQGKWAFYHEESGSQSFAKYGGPGVDVLAIHWCIDHGVDEYHHHRKDESTVHRIALDMVPLKGTRKRFDGRDRYIVPWESFHERAVYRVPWAAKEIVVTDDDLASPVASVVPLDRPTAPQQIGLDL